jgi:hypothetical protein
MADWIVYTTLSPGRLGPVTIVDGTPFANLRFSNEQHITEIVQVSTLQDIPAVAGNCCPVQQIDSELVPLYPSEYPTPGDP